jgi:hypothetical protein
MKHEPAAFSWKHDRKRSLEIYARWADQAWAEEMGSCPEMPSATEYRLGFRDGFVDYVWAGGNGEPPPVPPRQFWNAMLRSPDGKQGADLWFAGYRHGARVARFGGYRELGTIRSSLYGLEPHSNETGYPTEVPAPNIDDASCPMPTPEALPDPPVGQSVPTGSTVVDTPPQLANTVPTVRPGPAAVVPVQSTRPIALQPPAFEALGLALLPTDQPTLDPAAKRIGPHPQRREAQVPKQFDKPRVQSEPEDNCQTLFAPRIEPSADIPATPSTTSPESRPESAATNGTPAFRDIILQKTRDRGHVIAAAHLEPHVVELNHRQNGGGDTLDEAHHARAQSATPSVSKAPVEELPVVESLLREIPAIPPTSQSGKPEVGLQSSGYVPKQGAGSALKMVESSVHETAIGGSPPVEPSPSPRIRITNSDDRPVQRITFVSPPMANSTPADVDRSAIATSAIKVLSTTETPKQPSATGQTHLLRIVAP